MFVFEQDGLFLSHGKARRTCGALPGRVEEPGDVPTARLTDVRSVHISEVINPAVRGSGLERAAAPQRLALMKFWRPEIYGCWRKKKQNACVRSDGSLGCFTPNLRPPLHPLASNATCARGELCANWRGKLLPPPRSRKQSLNLLVCSPLAAEQRTQRR